MSEDGSTSEGQSQDYREKADIEDGKMIICIP